jgi:hypothetical protein
MVRFTKYLREGSVLLLYDIDTYAIKCFLDNRIGYLYVKSCLQGSGLGLIIKVRQTYSLLRARRAAMQEDDSKGCPSRPKRNGKFCYSIFLLGFRHRGHKA